MALLNNRPTFTLTHTVVNVANSTTAALAANAARCYVLLINDSDEAIYLNFGSTAALNAGVRLNANGGTFEIRPDGPMYVGAIAAICSSGSKKLLVTEGV